MGYPTSYRGGRGLQTGRRAATFPEIPPWVQLGPLAGAGAMLWASERLLNALSGFNWYGGRANPSAAGWTLSINCAGRQPIRDMRLATVTMCNTVVVPELNWNGGPHLPNSTGINLWDTRESRFVIIGVQRRYENVHAAQRWVRGTAPAIPPVSVWRFPGVLLGGPLAVPRRYMGGLSQRGYAPPGEPPIAQWRSRTFTRVDLHYRVIHDETGNPTAPARPVPVPRAIPVPMTREAKINVHTPAGRAFAGILMAFNFMGDTWGLTRALWRALPTDRRGSSARLGHMLNDLYRNWDYFGSGEGLALAFLNASLWKFQDTVMGSQQASMFQAQADVYGYNAARAWSFLDSQIRAGAQNVERRAAQGREQSSTAY